MARCKDFIQNNSSSAFVWSDQNIIQVPVLGENESLMIFWQQQNVNHSHKHYQPKMDFTQKILLILVQVLKEN